MRAEREDRLAYRPKKGPRPWLIAGIITAINLVILIFLEKTGWGIVIDLNKISDAFQVTYNRTEEKTKSDNSLIASEDSHSQPVEPILAPLPPATTLDSTPALSESNQDFFRQREQINSSYTVSLNKFNRIFIQHPNCNPQDMKWTQMDCSNFRARAMKRFHSEWHKGSYWDGERMISNPAADRIVNSEIYE